MKVGILTYHYSRNYGAILQALAVSQLTNGQIIDHRYKNKVAIYEQQSKHLEHLDRFVDERLPLSERRFTTDLFKNAETWKYAEENYSVLVCGSDELWKTSYRCRSRYAALESFIHHPFASIFEYGWKQQDPYSTAFPNVYWPRVNIPTVSFSASMGSTQWSSVPHRHKKKMLECLDQFVLISVRDQYTLNCLREVSREIASRIILLPDPVFGLILNDDPAPSALEKMTRFGIREEDEWGVFQLAPNLVAWGKDQIVKSGLKPLDILNCGLSPLEWYWAISRAKAAVVDMMHPLIVSLVHNVPCLSVDQRGKSRELRDLFEIQSFSSLSDAISTWPKNVPEKVDDYRRRVREFAEKIKLVAQQ